MPTRMTTRQSTKQQARYSNGLGDLAIIPPELRNRVYSLLVTAGSLSFLRCSSMIEQECKAIMRKDAIYRMVIVYGQLDCPPCETPASKGFPMADFLAKPKGFQPFKWLQHVDIRAHTANRLWANDIQPLQRAHVFAGSHNLRESCTITFICYPETAEMVSANMLEVFKGFTGFRIVVLSVELKWMADAQELSERQANMVKISLGMACETMKNELEPTMGVAAFKGEDFARRVEFYPRRNVLSADAAR